MNNKENTKRISFNMELDLYEKFDNFCYNHNLKKSEFLCVAVKEKLFKDGLLPNEKIFSFDE